MTRKLKPAEMLSEGEPIVFKYRPHGASGEMDALALAEFLKASVVALKDTSVAEAERRVKVRYLMTAVEKKSPTTMVLTPVAPRADLPHVQRAQKRHVQIAAAIDKGEIPQTVDFSALQSYQRLGKIAKRYNFSVDMRSNGDSAVIDKGIKDRLDLELTRDQFSYGSVIGTIQSYHSAKRRLIRLYPRVGPTLVCSFRERDQVTVRSNIDNLVTLSGRLRYRPNAYHPYFMEMETIVPIDTGNAPTFASMQGAFPDLRTVEPDSQDYTDGW